MKKKKEDGPNQEGKKRRPLEGIRVLECALYHAGPGGSAILGDLGAEVIKVEQPGDGDPIRGLTRIGSIPFEIPGRRNLFCEGAARTKKDQDNKPAEDAAGAVKNLDFKKCLEI